MIVATDTDLYTRGAATLLAFWEEYARGSAGAALERLDGVSAAVFPHGPERSVYNNALLDRDLGPDDRARAIEAMEAAYGARASTATPRGCTRPTTACAPSSAAAATPSPRPRARWAWRSQTSPPRSPSTSSCDRTRPNTSNRGLQPPCGPAQRG